MTPKVSVIIPVYNAVDYLGQCLDSILTQTLEDIEVICVDDGSKDESLTTLQGYGFLDARLSVLSQAHQGPNAARNLALKQAKGKYVLFLEASDFFESTMLEKMVAQAETDQSDVVVAGHFIFDNQLKQVIRTEQIGDKFLNNPIQTADDLGDQLFSFCNILLFNRLIRREVLLKNDLTFDEDIFLMADQSVGNLALACADKISLMSEAFVYHRTHIKIQENEIQDVFNDSMKSFGDLYKNLKRLGLEEKFYMPFLLRLKFSIFNFLEGYPNSKKKEALHSIKKYIPAKVVDSLLSASKYEPKISLIIPIYNGENYLAECLDSCLNQTLKDIEIICVDDGSIDGSLDLLKSYAQKDSRIQVLTQENQGQGAARNKAMEVAKGTYIQFLDSDDYLDPEACEYLYFYAKFLGLDMLSFSAKEFHYEPKEEFDNSYHCLPWLPEHYLTIFDWHNVNTTMPQLAVSACLTLYRRFFLLKNDLRWLDKKTAYEDTPFFIESALAGARMGALKFPFYHRRVHQLAITQQLPTNFVDCLAIIKYILPKIKKQASFDVFYAYCSVFLQKVWGNYAAFEPEDKVKHAGHLYDFLIYLSKKYHILLSSDVQDWCYRNMKHKSKREKLKLKMHFFLLKGRKNRYSLSLFDFQSSPEIYLKILGIPVFSYQEERQTVYKRTFKIFGITVLEIQEYSEQG